VYAVAAGSDVVYAIADSRQRLMVFDRIVPGLTDLLGEVTLPSAVTDIAASETLVYAVAAAAVGSRLFAVDATDPAAPRVVGNLLVPERVSEVEFVGDDLLAVYGPNGPLRVVDVSNPSQPAELAPIPDSDVSRARRGPPPYVVIADRAAGLQFWDLADPASPAPRATLAVPELGDFAVGDGGVYAVAGLDLLRGQEGAARTQATGRAAHPLAGSPAALATAPAPTTLRVLHIGIDPITNPRVLDSLEIDVFPWPVSLGLVEADGPRTYVQYDWGLGEWGTSVAAFHGSRLAGVVTLLAGQGAARMWATDGMLYLANGEGGLLEIEGPTGPVVDTPTPTATTTPRPETPSATPTSTVVGPSVTASPTHDVRTPTATATPLTPTPEPRYRAFVPRLENQ
jgi:hypothetical protein